MDIGLDRDAYLHVGDLRHLPSGQDDGDMAPDESLEGSPDGDDAHSESIEQPVEVGQLLTVQVSKDALPTKGVRITTEIAIPGRYLVLLPRSNELRISRRIEEESERERLSALLEDLLTATGGAIVRTAGEAVVRIVSPWTISDTSNKMDPVPRIDSGVMTVWISRP